MVRIMRGGRELTIPDTQVTEYLKSGYSVIDDKGNVITRATAITYDQAMRENAELKHQIGRLKKLLSESEAEIAELTKELVALKGAYDTAQASLQANQTQLPSDENKASQGDLATPKRKRQNKA